MSISRITGLVLMGMLAMSSAASTPVSKKASAAADQAAMKKEAKISMKQAQQIALKKAPGKIASSELERENGKLIYSFDIKGKKSGVTEVNVDAISGEVVAVQHENAAKEAAEKKQEAKEKATKH